MNKYLVLITVSILIIVFAVAVFKSGNQVGNQNKTSVERQSTTIRYKQVKTDLQIKAVIDSSQLVGGNLIVKFHHNSVKKEPISVSGHVEYQLDKTIIKPGEIVTLTVFNWSTEYFEIKVGEQSDHFSFGKKGESLDNDELVLKEFVRQGINKTDVVLDQDYAPAGKYINSYGGQSSPYTKTYRDTKSGKGISVISSLPMVTEDGAPIDVGWDTNGSKFTAKNNLFKVTVDGNSVEIVMKNDQPDGRKKNDKLTFHAQLFLNGKEQIPTGPVLLPTDPVNSNYSSNVLEWDYGICKRRLRLIEGEMLGTWVFESNPGGEVSLRYGQSGDFKLRLGKYAVSDSEELIEAEEFISPSGGYPFIIGDSVTIQPPSIDNYIFAYSATTNYGTDASLQLHSGSGYQQRILMQFDVSTVPAGATVTAATFSLYYYYYSLSDPNGQEEVIYRLRRSDWAETQSTWNIYKTGSNWGTVGAANTTTDIDTSLTTHSHVPASYGWQSWDVLTLVQDAITNQSNKLHMRIHQTSTGNYSVFYYSKDYATDSTLRPKLVITYTPLPTPTPTPTNTPTPTPLPATDINFESVNMQGVDYYANYGKPNGKFCAADKECQSTHCVDAVCCDTTCQDQLCQRCDSYSNAGAGTCGYISTAVDPNSECSDADCSSGNCSGTGYACGFASAGTDPHNYCTAANNCAITLNSASGQSCNTVCAGYTNTSGNCDGAGVCQAPAACSCIDTGYDAGATNSRGYYYLADPWFCMDLPVDCTDGMMNMGNVCSGHEAMWVNCLCQ